MAKTRVVGILGSTGSIGVNALNVLRKLNAGAGRDAFRVFGLSAQRNVDLLKRQIEEFRPSAAVVADAAAAAELRRWARARRVALTVWEGAAGLEKLAAAPQTDLLLSAVVGSVGLMPLLAAVRAGKTIALANKEALIVAGDLITSAARRSGATLIPVDSEHSAIFQCLIGGGTSSPFLNGKAKTGEFGKAIARIILTASGGAFYRRKGSLDAVTVQEALAHPTWKMGNKITIDCATLTNKGLEAIEAHHLFGVPLENIDIVVHPQSIVHSLVEFADGAMLAQLSHPDMRLPIQYALTYPDRLPSEVRPMRLAEIRTLEFYEPDFARFPCLALALKAGKLAGAWPAVFNGANEAAVRGFLEGRLSFLGIARAIAAVMAAFGRENGGRGAKSATLAEVLAADRWARARAEDAMASDRAPRRRPARELAAI